MRGAGDWRWRLGGALADGEIEGGGQKGIGDGDEEK